MDGEILLFGVCCDEINGLLKPVSPRKRWQNLLIFKIWIIHSNDLQQKLLFHADQQKSNSCLINDSALLLKSCKVMAADCQVSFVGKFMDSFTCTWRSWAFHKQVLSFLLYGSLQYSRLQRKFFFQYIESAAARDLVLWQSTLKCNNISIQNWLFFSIGHF